MPGARVVSPNALPMMIFGTRQYPPGDDPPFSSPSPGPIPSWFMQDVKMSAPATAKSAKNQEDRFHFITGTITDESERM